MNIWEYIVFGIMIVLTVGMIEAIFDTQIGALPIFGF